LRSSVIKIFGILALVFAGASVSSRLIFSLTPSDGKRVFFKLGSPQEAQVGDYVVFPHRTERVKGCESSCLLIKRVVCGPGSLLEVRGLDYFCDGRYLGRARLRDSSGRPVEPFVWSGVIPSGKLFVMGSHEKSYDSRYFGFVDKSWVVARARALF